MRWLLLVAFVVGCAEEAPAPAAPAEKPAEAARAPERSKAKAPVGEAAPSRPGKVFFVAGISGDLEPWVSDGTSAGTLRLADIRAANPGQDRGQVSDPQAGDVREPGHVLVPARKDP